MSLQPPSSTCKALCARGHEHKKHGSNAPGETAEIIFEVAHQDTIATTTVQITLRATAGGHEHEEALQKERLPGGDDVCATAAQRAQQAQQLQHLAQHGLVQDGRQCRLKSLRLCFTT